MKRGRPNKVSDDDFRELHAEGCTNIEMSEIFGIGTDTVAHRLKDLGLTKNPRRNRFRKQFTAHDRDTGVLLAKGTMSEIAEQLNREERTLFSYCSAVRCDHRPLPPVLIREVEND